MAVYYNEFDSYAAQWLRNLIDAGHIAPGDVDERDIRDVNAADLAGYTQCHFFAGIGGWSLALRLAGWPDDRPVWTGSCPCQPFSSAGKRRGVDDERHLWPAWRDFIAQCRPATVFGEQVASADGRSWLATVRAEMEALGYAVGAADLCGASVGAPHIRQRLWFVGQRLGDPGSAGLAQRERVGRVQPGTGGTPAGQAAVLGSHARGLADADSGQRRRVATGEGRQRDGAAAGRKQGDGELAASGELERLADACLQRRQQDAGSSPCDEEAHGRARRDWMQPGGDYFASSHGSDSRPSAPHSPWRDADWLYCRDGKWRPVEPGTFPLADGLPGRVGRLRAYGNAIVPQVAAAFVSAAMEQTTNAQCQEGA